MIVILGSCWKLDASPPNGAQGRLQGDQGSSATVRVGSETSEEDPGRRESIRAQYEDRSTTAEEEQKPHTDTQEEWQQQQNR